MNQQVSPHPARFASVEEVDEYLSRPTPEVAAALGALPGDIMLLGAGGKMGPSLALLARRTCDQVGLAKRVIAVSRFSSAAVREQLGRAGVETISCDLLDEAELRALPEAANIVYLVGTKFGATGREAQTWALNAYLPGLVVNRFRRSRIVLFSSGNVYPLAPLSQGGCTEETPPAPIGEYAQSVLGRERVFAHFAGQWRIPGVIIRLNYAVELRYGVLLDVARLVWEGQPVDVGMGQVNVIWQGDANAVALRCLAHADAPPWVLNLTGQETIAIRALAGQFGRLLGRQPLITGNEQPDALLSNASLAHKLFGYPRVPLQQVIEWVAAWVQANHPTLGKPTGFQTRDGRF